MGFFLRCAVRCTVPPRRRRAKSHRPRHRAVAQLLWSNRQFSRFRTSASRGSVYTPAHSFRPTFFGLVFNKLFVFLCLFVHPSRQPGCIQWSKKRNCGLCRHHKALLSRKKGSGAMLGRRFFGKLLRHSLCLTAGLLAFAACAYTDYRLWPLDLPHPRKPVLSAPQIQGDRLVLPFATGVASARVATFHDQLEAFLHFEYLRGREAQESSDTPGILLIAVDTSTGPSYEIFIVSDNDLLTAVPHLTQLEGRNLIAGYDLITWTEKDFAYYQQQSHMFDVAYGVPTEQKLESLNSFQLLPPPADARTGDPARRRHSRRRPVLFTSARLLPGSRRHGERLHGC